MTSKYEKPNNSATGASHQRLHPPSLGGSPSLRDDQRPKVKLRKILEARRQKHLAKAAEAQAQLDASPPERGSAGRPRRLQDGVVNDATKKFLERFCKTMASRTDRQASLEEIAEELDGPVSVDATAKKLRRIFKDMRDHETARASARGLPPRNRLFFVGRRI